MLDKRRFNLLIPVFSAAALLSAATLAHASEPAPAPPVPAPTIPGPLTLTGSAVWDGLQDSSVIISLQNGKQLSGTVVAHDRDKVALARLRDGSVVAVPKQQVASVHLMSPAALARATREASLPAVAERPVNDGRKQHIGGAVVLGLGVPVGLGGIGMSWVPYIGIPVSLVGAGLIVVGAVMIKRSKARDAAFRKAWGIPRLGTPGRSSLQLIPTLDVGRGGGQLGFAMRF